MNTSSFRSLLALNAAAPPLCWHPSSPLVAPPWLIVCRPSLAPVLDLRALALVCPRPCNPVPTCYPCPRARPRPRSLPPRPRPQPSPLLTVPSCSLPAALVLAPHSHPAPSHPVPARYPRPRALAPVPVPVRYPRPPPAPSLIVPSCLLPATLVLAPRRPDSRALALVARALAPSSRSLPRVASGLPSLPVPSCPAPFATPCPRRHPPRSLAVPSCLLPAPSHPLPTALVLDICPCNSPIKPPRYSPPDTQIIYTLAVHREKPHLSALLVRYRCLRLRDLRSLCTWDSGLPWYLRRGATAGAGREGWMGTGPRYSVTLRLAQRCNRWASGMGAGVVWGAASRWADSGVVAKGRCGTARKAHAGNCRGQYGMCRQQSRGVAVGSITEALPGAAECEEMYAPYGAGRSVDEHIA
ncbi:hypothetical protein B0H14DRAFT_3429710 [Mycena olivaceomarginata]|nr:hypothetical protein B0H14DRAFT_3429710 [Mycena olivaceomarginata]